ncbi:MAG: aminoacyl-tRNA hydrolase [Chitinophagaceae bacterium]|nr:aminoacyl-tRNA hydrolase [Chitinophagaceae bacterium]
MKFLIAGLGNIGDEYKNTRHNIGFDIVHAFVQKHGGRFTLERLAYKSEIQWHGRHFICICPTTFMNLSGKAVKYWMDFCKIDLARLLVIVDDISLPLTKLRLRPGGSSAGHNGLKSIEESLGTQQFARLRFGIGNDFPKGSQSQFVLSRWKNEEKPLVQLKTEKAVEVIERFAVEGIQLTMNFINNQIFT